MSEYKTLNNIAYDHLRGMIYNGEMEFNRIYSETKLARELSISRTPMRDALNRLAQERFIDILPNRGFMLHKPTQADIIEAYHVRMMMEGYCGRIVTRHYPNPRSRIAIGAMEDTLEQQQRLLSDDGTYSLNRFWMDDLAFHRALLEYMDISSLIMQYESIMYIFMPHHLIEGADARNLHPRTLERHRSTLAEHAAIIEGLKSRNPERTTDAIRAHLDASLRALYVPLED